MLSNYVFLRRRVFRIYLGLVQKVFCYLGFVSRTKSRGIGNNSGEEFEFIQSKLDVLIPGNSINFLDVGANTGNWFKRFKNIVELNGKTIESVLVEPIPEFVKHLKSQFDGSGIIIVEAFLSSGIEVSEIYSIGGGGRSFGIPKITSKAKVRYELLSNTGDNLLHSLGFVPDLIKIDVDGNEGNVLRGFESTLKNHSPVLIWEYSATFAMEAGFSLRKIIRYLDSLKYTTFAIDDSGETFKPLLFGLEVIPGQTKNYASWRISP